MAIELSRVSVRDGLDEHIYPTDLKLRQHGFNILLGTTLAGKTSLMRVMAGLLVPDTGRVLFAGSDVTDVAVQKRNVSMVYQQFINYSNLSVFDNIASPLRVAGYSRNDIRQRVNTVAQLLKLGPMLKRRPSELSGGQQQRTALARALVKDASLVLLDEPLANLDYKLREELREELPRLFRDRGVTVVYATTEPTEALLLGGHTAALDAGQVTQFGVTRDVYRSPGDLRTAQVFSDPPLNLARATIRDGFIELRNGIRWPAPVWLPAIDDVIVAVRAHHLLPFSPDSEASVSATVKGEVLVTEVSGSESVIHLDVGVAEASDTKTSTWVSQSHGVHRYQRGAWVDMYIQTEACLYFRPNGQALGLRRPDRQLPYAEELAGGLDGGQRQLPQARLGVRY